MNRVPRAAIPLLSCALLYSALAQAQGSLSQPVITPAAPAADTSASPAAPAAAPNTGAVSPDYLIGPGDQLEINVWKEPTLSGTLPVRPDGMISLSLVGDLPASGMTPTQLGQQVGLRLKKFMNDPPPVTVTVLGVNSKHVFLLGEIARVGPLPLTPGLSPLQAIASAGGLTPYANAKHIYILRTAAGKQQKIPFDYRKAIKTGDMQGVALLSGDTIVVP